MSATYNLVVFCDSKTFLKDLVTMSEISEEPQKNYDEYYSDPDNTIDEFAQALENRASRSMNVNIEEIEFDNIRKISYNIDSVNFTVSVPLELQDLPKIADKDVIIARLDLNIRRKGAHIDFNEIITDLRIILARLNILLGFFSIDWSLIPQYNSYYLEGKFKYSFEQITNRHPDIIINKQLARQIQQQSVEDYSYGREAIELNEELLLLKGLY